MIGSLTEMKDSFDARFDQIQKQLALMNPPPKTAEEVSPKVAEEVSPDATPAVYLEGARGRWPSLGNESEAGRDRGESGIAVDLDSGGRDSVGLKVAD